MGASTRGDAGRTRAGVVAIACVALGCASAASAESEPAFDASPLLAPFKTAPGGASCADAGDDARAVRTSITRLRAMAGLAPLDCDDALATAAAAHCRYLAMNGVFSHLEVAGAPGFTGVGARDRLVAAGFSGELAGEVISTLRGAPAIESEYGFLDSVYHRAPFLRSDTATYGAGFAAGCTTIDFARARDAVVDDALVLWPPDGASNAPPRFHAGAETPNPTPPYVLVGAPVSLVSSPALDDVEASLRGPDGDVAAIVLTDETDLVGLMRPGEAHLVPLAPLRPSTSYVARFAFVRGGRAETATTTFTTRAE